ERERQLDVRWDSGEEQSFPARIRVVYDGEKGGFGILSALLGQYDVTVSDVTMSNIMDGLVVCRMRIEVRDTEHLNRVLTALKSEKTVHEAQRVND
ncbi:MAG: GTP pyrophosphokinase, partial [Syntrophobacteraceae bacterium CG07_land_8_20_14_0_80_61_8]